MTMRTLKITPDEFSKTLLHFGVVLFVVIILIRFPEYLDAISRLVV